ncbi:MAG TPA: hypothetical protein VM100_00805 [Longimicrobiales bacterium]|nr:hypothetical protein [Longimicrobiales bacterium]
MRTFLVSIPFVLSASALCAQTPVRPSADRVQALLGWVADPSHRAAVLEPHLPVTWSIVSYPNLMVGKDRIEVTITQDEDVYSVTLHRVTPGPPISIRIAPGLPLGARVDRITVNEFDVAVQVEITEHDIHPLTEMLLFTDAVIEFHHSLR